MGLGERIASYFVSIGADTSGMEKGFQQTKTGMSGLTKAIGLGVAVIGSHYVKMAAAAYVELGRMDAQHKRLSVSMDQLAQQYGGSAQKIMTALRQASSGTVDDMSLTLSANRAMMLGLGADAEKTGDLMEVARFRGRAMGLSTAQAFSDIVTGIGRASPLILDNLGIVIDAENTYAKYAESLGKTASALSETEKKQALLNSVLVEGGKQIELAGGIENDDVDRLEALAAAWANLKVVVGDSAWMGTAASALTSMLNVLAGSMDPTNLSAQQKSLQEQISYRQMLLANGAGAMAAANTNPEKVKQEITALQAELALVVGAIGQSSLATSELGAAWNGIPGQIQPVVDKVEEINSRLVNWPDLLQASFGAVGAGKMYDFFNTMETQLIDIENQFQTKKNDLIEQEVKAKEKAIDATNRLREAEARQLQSTIMGYMTATSVTELDMYQTGQGTYQNKWDEYGRRMQDIVNQGEASPFASQYFGGMGGDELKFAAMQGKEDFYAGVNWGEMTPEDRETMIQGLTTQVQRGMQGDANKEALAAEVAARLGTTTGVVSQIGGLGLMSAEGKSSGDDIMAGIKEQMGQNEFIAPLAQAFRDDLAENKQLLLDAGKSAGNTLTAGALKAVKETQWINAMAEAVAPAVARIIDREAER